MPKKSDSKYEIAPTVTLNGPEEFTVLGFAADLGTCTANTKVGSKCVNFVNLSVSQMCPTHMLQQFNRATSQRGEFSARTGNIRLGDKYKEYGSTGYLQKGKIKDDEIILQDMVSISAH